MPKLIEKQLDINLIKRTLVFSLIYCVLFNSVVFIDKYNYHQSGTFGAIMSLSKEFVFVLLFSFIFFLGLSLHKYLFIFGGGFLFLTGGIASFCLYLFDITPNLHAMEELFSMDQEQFLSNLTIKLLVWLIFVLFVFISSIRQFGAEHSTLFFTKLISAVCLFLSINSIISPHYRLLASYLPLQYLNSFYLYLTG